MKKENLVVRNLYDNEGYSEKVILEESEIIKCVEKWLKENSFSNVIKEHGICRTTQTSGICIVVQIDTRDGKISVFEDTPGESNANDPFFITLACKQEIELDKKDILGEAVTLSLTSDVLDTLLGENWSEDYDFEKNDDGSYKVNYSDVEYSLPISVEDWMNKYSSENYDESIEALLDEHLEDVGSEWRDGVQEYYNNLR